MSARRRHQARRARIASLSLLLAVLAAGAAPAQVWLQGSSTSPPPAEGAPAAPDAASLAADREQIATSLAELRATVAAGEPEAAVLERIGLLERLDRTLSAHADALATLDERRAALAAPGQASGLISADPPYPFALYEATSEALAAHRKYTEVVEERARVERKET
jgi:hypothetical protein